MEGCVRVVPRSTAGRASRQGTLFLCLRVRWQPTATKDQGGRKTHVQESINGHELCPA